MKKKLIVLITIVVLAIGGVSVAYAQGGTEVNSNKAIRSASCQNTNNFNDMIKIMRDNGYSDAAKAMENKDFDSMNKFMNNLSDEDYKKMTEIMKTNGYAPMVNMMGR